MKRISLFAVTLMAAMCIGCSAMAYSDIKTTDWYYDNITAMSEKGLLTGYEDNTFRPYREMTYAEFVSVLTRYIAPSAIKDKNGHWAGGAMEYAYGNGWYDYDEINAQLYDTAIPRYMAVKLASLALDIPKTENDDGVYWRYMNEIKDFNDIDGRYAYLVVRAYNNGILTGDENGNFNPKSHLTRAEACAIISRAALNMPEAPVMPEATAELSVPENAIRSGAAENGALKVVGTQLCNENGEAVVLRGMSTHGLQWFGNYTDKNTSASLAAAGANVLRLAMYTSEGGYLSQSENVKKTLYEGIESASAADMYVIIDWHILSDGDPMTNIDAAAAFFDEVSSKYGDAKNIIYEICNEPNGGVSWEGNVKPYAERIIPIIRKNAPGSVILVGSPTWSQDFDKAADNPLNFENIMYTCHFYAGTHGQWLRDRITYALGKGAPIFVSEWGTSAADGSGSVFLEESQKWLEFLNSKNISWVNWSMCDKAETSAALSAGAGTDLSKLSESGKFVFANFR